MGATELSTLVEKLGDDDPKVRQQACKDLAKLNDPAAIPSLAKIYEDDEDSKVRAAAEAALKKYAAQMSGGASPTMRYAVIGLGVSLLVLLILNVVLRLGGSEEPPPVQAGPSNRADLIAAYQDLLTKTQADVATMQAEWSRGSGQLTCNATLNRVQERPLSEADKAIYPDFGFVDQLNVRIFTLKAVISAWDLACNDGTKGTIDQTITASDRLNQLAAALPAIEADLNEAITNPLPTLGAPPTDIPAVAPETPTPDPALAPTTDPALVPTIDAAVVTPTPG